MPGYFGKLLFPNASRSERRRKVHAIYRWIVIGAVLVAAVVGILLLMNMSGKLAAPQFNGFATSFV